MKIPSSKGFSIFIMQIECQKNTSIHISLIFRVLQCYIFYLAICFYDYSNVFSLQRLIKDSYYLKYLEIISYINE